MYAFNKRFRPTTSLGGFTVLTLAMAVLGALFAIFSFGVIFIYKNALIGALLIMLVILCWWVAINTHRNLKINRIRYSMFIGRRDMKKKPSVTNYG